MSTLDKMLVASIAFFVLVVGVVAYVAIADEKAWRAYAEAHHCRAVGDRLITNTIWSSGTPGTANHPGTPGHGSTYTTPVTTWACDDGTTHEREGRAW